MKNKNILVVGATGSLGNNIVQQLLKKGANVTAMVRETSDRSKLKEMGVKSFTVADMLDKQSLEKAITPNFDAIVSSAAGYTQGESKTDTVGYQNLVDATKKAGISRFVLISILESDKAEDVPHFYNKYRIEKYLEEKQQPYIALRAGAFFEFSEDYMLKKIKKGVVPMFFYDADYGTIYSPDLARYAAMAATTLPDSALNTKVDVGWSEPVNGEKLAAAFENVLGKPMKPKPVITPFVVNYIAPIFAKLSGRVKDMYEMVKWVHTGEYVSSNTQKQKELFEDLPSIEEGVRRYCRDKGLLD